MFIIRTDLPVLGGTDRPGKFCYNFSIPNDFTQIVNFPTYIPECDSHSPTFFDFFLSLDASICFTRAFISLRNSDHFFVSVSIDFPISYKRDAMFHRIAYRAIANWDCLCDHLRDSLLRSIYLQKI